MANVNMVSMKAQELEQGVMVCLIMETKHLQDAIDKAATCAEGGLLSLYVQSKFRQFQTTAGQVNMNRCVLVSTCATAQAMSSLYATVRTFKDGAVAEEGVAKTLEITLQKEFAADIAACDGFPQVVIGISGAGIRIEAQNSDKDERQFFIALSEEAPARFSAKGGPEKIELSVPGQEMVEAAAFAAAGAYAPEKGGNIVSFYPEFTPDGLELIGVGFDQHGAARASVKVKEVSEDQETLRTFFAGFCPVDAKRLLSVMTVESLKGSNRMVNIRFFQDIKDGKRTFRRMDFLIGENVYMLVASSREVPAAIMKFFGTGKSNVVMTTDVKALGRAVSVAEIGSGKGAAVTITVEGTGDGAGLRISDKTGTHTAKCMQVKVSEAPEGATITCGTGMLKNALRNAGESAEFRFCHGGIDPIRLSNAKGWQAVFMPVVLKGEEAESQEKE